MRWTVLRVFACRSLS